MHNTAVYGLTIILTLIFLTIVYRHYTSRNVFVVNNKLKIGNRETIDFTDVIKVELLKDCRLTNNKQFYPIINLIYNHRNSVKSFQTIPAYKSTNSTNVFLVIGKPYKINLYLTSVNALNQNVLSENTKKFINGDEIQYSQIETVNDAKAFESKLYPVSGSFRIA